MHEKPNGSERRFWRRFFLNLDKGDNTCRVRDDQGNSGRVRVVNISLGGALLRLADDAPDGSGSLEGFREMQELSFEDCEVGKWGRHLCEAGGYVRWVVGERECGCQFFSPLGASPAGYKK